MSQRILVVDDDIQLVRLLQSYLGQAGYQVTTALDGKKALHEIHTTRPDLILLDLLLPERDGWDITRLIRADSQLKATPIIMLTARVEDNDTIVGLELGADDYIPKPFNPREVLARVRAVLRRAQGESHAPLRLQAGSSSLDHDRHEARLDDALLELTPTEFALLAALMNYPEHVFTRQELIERALGYTYEGLERTIDSHIKHMRRKIEADASQPVAIETVYGVGYRLHIAAPTGGAP